MRIISLTSIPPRFDQIGPTLKSLLNQRQPADKVLLYLPKVYRRFPDYDGNLPTVPEGVEIRVVDHDFGPASKILHAIRDFRGQDVEILFCDDDRHYYRRWTKVFFDARRDRPHDVIAPLSWDADFFIGDSTQSNRPQPRANGRERRESLEFQLEDLVWQVRSLFNRNLEGPSLRFVKTSGYRDIFQGYGGVMVRPEFFDDDVFDIPEIMWAVDDIWLSGMLTKAGRNIWAPANVKGPRLTSAHSAAPLYSQIIDGVDRRTADRHCYDFMRKEYGLWP